MIGTTTLKQYGFNHIEDYFNYIVDSQINGNHAQVKELFKKLSDEEKNYFFTFLKEQEIKFDYTGIY